MDDQERNGLERWLNEKWKHGPCPVCGASAWCTNPRLGQLVNLDNMGGRIPVLVIGCGNCGYFLTVNALAAGVRPSEAATARPGEPVFLFVEDDETAEKGE